VGPFREPVRIALHSITHAMSLSTDRSPLDSGYKKKIAAAAELRFSNVILPKGDKKRARSACGQQLPELQGPPLAYMTGHDQPLSRPVASSQTYRIALIGVRHMEDVLNRSIVHPVPGVCAVSPSVEHVCARSPRGREVS
jgi:hypothetical protein